MDGLLMKYFVLKPGGLSLHAKASRAAMRTYATLICAENEKFSDELRDWADREQAAATPDATAS